MKLDIKITVTGDHGYKVIASAEASLTATALKSGTINELAVTIASDVAEQLAASAKSPDKTPEPQDVAPAFRHDDGTL